jgi:uncharacterized membrane protein YgcG
MDESVSMTSGATDWRRWWSDVSPEQRPLWAMGAAAAVVLVLLGGWNLAFSRDRQALTMPSGAPGGMMAAGGGMPRRGSRPGIPGFNESLNGDGGGAPPSTAPNADTPFMPGNPPPPGNGAPAAPGAAPNPANPSPNGATPPGQPVSGFAPRPGMQPNGAPAGGTRGGGRPGGPPGTGTPGAGRWNGGQGGAGGPGGQGGAGGPGGGRFGGNPEERATRTATQLGLNADQTAKFVAIAKKYGDKQTALRADTSLSDDDRRQRSSQLRTEQGAEEDAILTPEQKAKRDEMRASRRGGRGGGGFGGGGGQGGPPAGP